MTAITVSFPLYPPVSILFVWGKSLDYLCPHQVYGNLTKVSHWKVLFSVAKEYDLGITPAPASHSYLISYPYFRMVNSDQFFSLWLTAVG